MQTLKNQGILNWVILKFYSYAKGPEFRTQNLENWIRVHFYYELWIAEWIQSSYLNFEWSPKQSFKIWISQKC